MRVARPCSMTWESFGGDDERVRSCDLCRHNVYNTAGMTRAEIAALVSTREGRLCVRLYRRADGTLITADCPVGVRQYARRVGRLASAAAALIFGLAGAAYGQKGYEEYKKGSIKISVEKVQDAAGVRGTVYDIYGAVITNAAIDIYRGAVDEKRDPQVKPLVALRSDDLGRFSAEELGVGTYTVEITAAMTRPVMRTFTVKKGTVVNLKVHAGLADNQIIVGMLETSEPLIDMSSSTVQTTIVPAKLRIPY
jgi:hypothetical protein